MTILSTFKDWFHEMLDRGIVFSHAALAALKADLPTIEHAGVLALQEEALKAISAVEAKFVAADGQVKWDSAMAAFEAAIKAAGGDFLALMNNQTVRDTILQDVFCAFKAGILASVA